MVRPPRMATPKACKPRVVEHAFELDESVPADFYGHRTCSGCGKLGAEGDLQHPHGALPLELARHPPSPPGAQEWEARRLGEPP